nr:MAG TPA: hypothetical protein [Caudoviricetes sp.]
MEEVNGTSIYSPIIYCKDTKNRNFVGNNQIYQNL